MEKRSSILIYPFVIMGLILMLTNNCKKKEEVPVVTTIAISDTAGNTATSGGDITSDGGAAVTLRGVCWSKKVQTPTFLECAKTLDGSGTGSFISSMTSLYDNTTYYVRAYALNSAGIGYGNTLSFKTKEIYVPPCYLDAGTMDSFVGAWTFFEEGDSPYYLEDSPGTVNFIRGEGENEFLIKSEGGLPIFLSEPFREWGELFQESVPPVGDILFTVDTTNKIIEFPWAYWGQTLPGPWDYWYLGSGTINGCPTMTSITMIFSMDWGGSGEVAMTNTITLTKQ
jgi:hypothetical protein